MTEGPIRGTSSWPAEWGIDPNSGSLFEVLGAVSKRFEQERQIYLTRLREHERDLPQLITFMVGNSWYPDLDMPLRNAIAFEELIKAGKFAEVEAHLENYHRNTAKELEARLNAAYPARTQVLSEAFQAFYEGRRFTLAIPVLLSQADGISEELLSAHFFQKGQSIPQSRTLIASRGFDSYVAALADPLLRAGVVRENTDRLPPGQHFNRHAVVHGADLTYGSERNALKCLSLLAYLLGIGDFLK